MNKLVKSIETNHYYLELRQIEDEYVVHSESLDRSYTSSRLDYRTASAQFDEEVQRLEGN